MGSAPIQATYTIYTRPKRKKVVFFHTILFFRCNVPAGPHSNIIVPPSWIVKLPRKGSFKSSLRKSPKKKPAGKKKSKEKEAKTFVIKPIPTANVTPVLVFINPKSGGNQVINEIMPNMDVLCICNCLYPLSYRNQSELHLEYNFLMSSIQTFILRL